MRLTFTIQPQFGGHNISISVTSPSAHFCIRSSRFKEYKRPLVLDISENTLSNLCWWRANTFPLKYVDPEIILYESSYS